MKCQAAHKMWQTIARTLCTVHKNKQTKGFSRERKQTLVASCICEKSAYHNDAGTMGPVGAAAPPPSNFETMGDTAPPPNFHWRTCPFIIVQIYINMRYIRRQPATSKRIVSLS